MLNKYPKPRLLIIGHGRHGKDTVAEMISNIMQLKFTSSSYFVAEECIWNMWGKERYNSFEEMFEDRVNFRPTWKNLILAWNTPDRTRTAVTMLSRGNDMYVGMRSRLEFDANDENETFDYVIWVDASKRLPPEPEDSMELTVDDADIVIDNNEEGTIHLFPQIHQLAKRLHQKGFSVGIPREVEHPEEDAFQLPGVTEEAPKLGNRLEWEDMPEDAVPVLDHGFFSIKEVMCSDKEIAESARMSYGRGTKKVNNDQGLINYLVRNHHTSPLEMGEIRFHMRLPIFVMRQLVRHRTANLNEYSGRYSKMVRLFYTPELSKIMCQGTVNKQMSGAPLPKEDAEKAWGIIRDSSNGSFDSYEELLANDVSRETARIVLPLNTYTECVWKMDISNLIKFLYLRDDKHAQWEIRVYAMKIAEAVEQHFPLVYAAYMRERESVKLTPKMIETLITGEDVDGMSKSEIAEIQRLFDKYL